MDIGAAVDRLRAGQRVCRAGWNGKGMWLTLEAPGEMSLPYVALYTAQGDSVPWTCSQSDLLANDWELAS